ncbi:hypothetical protein, partial [Salmonella enterica]|uniref:hypothetical protein n=1 Tax=Salmonella enterica TaxID=28901 RepID=UPI0020C3C8DA
AARVTIAGFAFIIRLFALAQKTPRRQLGRAFQASSPKNFHGLVFGPALFFCLSRARGHVVGPEALRSRVAPL